jgi:hypothetical protein
VEEVIFSRPSVVGTVAAVATAATSPPSASSSQVQAQWEWQQQPLLYPFYLLQSECGGDSSGNSNNFPSLPFSGLSVWATMAAVLVATKSNGPFLFWELPLKQDTSIALQPTNRSLKLTIESSRGQILVFINEMSNIWNVQY